jgi:LysR family glycine cleavage system transcriptional activator
MLPVRNRLPPLNALRAFEAAARHLNFRLAAEELGVTQGAVAQHVRALEADLGIRLFDRLPRSVALTEQGRSYAHQLRRAFEAMTQATAALRCEPLRLTISVSPTFASKWLIPRLPDFTEAHPEIELRILASEGLANFRSDGVDVAVRQGGPPFAADIAADLLFEQRLVAVGSPRLLGDPPRPLPAADLDRFTLLSDTHDHWPEFAERALERRFSPTGKQLRFSQTSLAIDAAIAGQGLALAADFLVEQDIDAKRLVRAFASEMRGRMDSFVVSLRRPRRPEPTEILRRWLLARRRPQAIAASGGAEGRLK